MRKITPLLLFLLCANVVVGQFGSLNDITKTTSDPMDVKCFDLDGDGDLDVLSASFGDNKIAWYENLGNGVYGIQQIITKSSKGARSVYAADLDLDGDLDVLSASSGDNKIAWYENLGGGIFGSQQVITSTSIGASSVFANDLDGDGDFDIITASTGDNKVAWYENLGGGVFGLQQILGYPGNPVSVFSTDMDNDGDQDVLSIAYNNLSWYENLGTGSFNSIIISNSVLNGTFVYAEDLDNDGDKDIITVEQGDSKVSWYENYGGGNFGSEQIIVNYSNVANNWISAYVADMDNDGDFDVLTSAAAWDQIRLYENLGTGSFNSTALIVTNFVLDALNTIFTGDLDGDGDMDVLSSSGSLGEIASFENQGGGVFGFKYTICASAENPSSTYPADLDNDGDFDLLLSSHKDDKFSWYENLGGYFGKQKIVGNTSWSPNYVCAEDLDGDGDLDVLGAAGLDDKILWHENLGGGVFGVEQIISDSLENTVYVGAYDLDNDGDKDVVSGSSTLQKIVWHENLGNGVFGVEQIIASLFGTVWMSCKDMDNDGDIDIVATAVTQDRISLFENLGNGIFNTEQLITDSLDNSENIILADLNNDGYEDIIVPRYWYSDQIVWFPNNGGLTFGSKQVLYNESGLINVVSVYTSDIDGDGDLDLLATDRTQNRIIWFENYGGGSFSSYQLINNITYSPGDLKTADIDGDGDEDIIFTSSVENLLAWHENFFNSPYKLKGRVFFDNNENGQQDSNDYALPFVQLNLQPNQLASYTSGLGDYLFATDTGSYTLSYSPIPMWHLTTDSATYSPTITISNSVVDSLDFGFYPDTIQTIIEPIVIGNPVRCDLVINNMYVIAKNIGTTVPNGIIQLTIHDSLTFLSSSIVPDSIVGKNIYWHFDSLFYFTDKLINYKVQAPSVASLGETFDFILTVSELDTSNTVVYSVTDTISELFYCAFDPNDKNVNPKGLSDEGYILNNQELEYIIRFQNTGNDTARTVVIRDQLDVDLNWTSMYIIASSHPMQVSIEQGGEAVFKFENIMLPDSGADYLGSQGFVKFSIEMSPNLLPETTILNEGHIYFDFNPAIITNKVVNTIYNCNEISFNLIDTVCYGEQVVAFTLNEEFSDLTWEIDTFYTSFNDTLDWISDTSDVFSLKLSVQNELCSKDTTVSITVFPETPISNSTQSICQGDSMLIYGNYQSVAGTYYDSLQTINGCDSVLSITLSVNPVYLSNTNDTICQGDSVLIYGSYQSVAGTYYDSLQTINGCDSVLTTTLFLNANFNTSQNQEICQGDSILIYGTYQYTSGVYYDSLQTLNGCDSVLSTTLTVNPLPNVTLANFNPDTICSNSNAVGLPNGSPSGGVYSGTGVNGGTFDPSTAGIGTHSVIYTYTDINSCINSDSTFITVEQCVGMNDLAKDLGILIYPNPNTGLFTIEKSSKLDKEVKVSLLDATSRVIIDKLIPKGQQKIEMDITNYSKGVYYLQLTVGKEVFVKKILKN